MLPLPNTRKVEPQVPKNQEQALVSIMGHEANSHLIQALEEQIEEGNGAVTKLKRARNSLLNMSTRVPPEILREIFIRRPHRDTSRSLRPPNRHFDGLPKGGYNFLHICHHWLEIAFRTPEPRSFLGNTLQDWKKRHHRSGAVPLDLVLDGDKSDPGILFEVPLREAVRNRFA